MLSNNRSALSFPVFGQLIKPRITLLVLVTAFLGYFLALHNTRMSPLNISDVFLLIHLLTGTFLSSSGVSVLNQVMEWKYDGLMDRTKHRPIPSGKITVKSAFILGIILSLSGVGYLLLFTNILTGVLALLTILLYTLIYTPSKRMTTLNTLIGSVPGALPPVGGWVSVSGSFDAPAWILFGILFCWQIPHFLSIAYLYAADYQKGGFKMLPGEFPNGQPTRYAVLFFTILIPVIAIGLFVVESAGLIYAIGSAIIGIIFLGLAIKNVPFRSRKNALAIMFGSITYLPILLLIIILDVII